MKITKKEEFKLWLMDKELEIKFALTWLGLILLNILCAHYIGHYF